MEVYFTTIGNTGVAGTTFNSLQVLKPNWWKGKHRFKPIAAQWIAGFLHVILHHIYTKISKYTSL